MAVRGSWIVHYRDDRRLRRQFAKSLIGPDLGKPNIIMARQNRQDPQKSLDRISMDSSSDYTCVTRNEKAEIELRSIRARLIFLRHT
jgi:hypothetical protein